MPPMVRTGPAGETAGTPYPGSRPSNGTPSPGWTTRPETARRVRQRMRTVFRWAMAHEAIESNPAGEAIDGALPSMPKVKAHLRALPYQETAEALRTVDGSPTSPASKLRLRFLVLTAARSGEARGAAWDEIDPDGATWTVPGSRMKSGEEHRVPLSAQALEVLEGAHHLRDGSPLCFPSPLRPGRMLSDVTLTKVLRTNGLADRATVHGFRTSFRTWTMEQTQTPWEVAEAALAHRLARIHRRRASGQCPEAAGGCSCESGIMVLNQQSRPQNKEHPIDATTQPSRPHPYRLRRHPAGGQCWAAPPGDPSPAPGPA